MPPRYFTDDTKLKFVQTTVDRDPVVTSTAEESVSDIIAFALLARRNDMMAARGQSDSEEEDAEAWE